jgi:threonyl-tRNA synthetase
LIIGQKEMDNETVSVREHTKGDIGTKSIEEIIDIFTDLLVDKK